MDIILGVLRESIYLLGEMAPYLLFGYFVAGILKVLVSQEKIVSFLGSGKITSSINASILGIPLPLCSCGVIPTAIALRRQGANVGATLSFLISTPTTGVDSIFATYSLLGPIFTAFRVGVSFVAAVLCGIIANFFITDTQNISNVSYECTGGCCATENKSDSLMKKIRNILHYGFVELMRDTGKWIIIGIVIGGAISYFIPNEFIERYLGSNLTSMFLMLIIGIPIYVCATGSIPIAAALMLKGMSPGAALVFLVSGPASNSVTITVLAKELGKKAIYLYLLLISITAIAGGYILNLIWPYDTINYLNQIPGKILPYWLKISSAVILVALIGNALKDKFIVSKKSNSFVLNKENIVLDVPDMSCEHCVSTIKNTLLSNHISDFTIDLNNKKIILSKKYEANREYIINILANAGYNVTNK